MKLESSRIIELDGLRGMAIALVILFHLVLLAPTPWLRVNQVLLFGWSGVDLFFVLSGFLIGGILLDNRGATNYFSAFYVRRFFRIVPIYFGIVALYFLVYAAGGLIAGGLLRSELIGSLGPPMPLFSYLSFTNNFWLARHDTMGVFDAPTWSLAIEEQFYLTLPLILKLVKPKYLPGLIGVMIGGVAALRIVLALGHRVTQLQVYVLPFFRADALMLGVACALAVRNEKIRRFLRKSPWLLYAALVFFAAAVIHTGGSLDKDTAHSINTYGFTAVAFLYATLLMIGVVLPHHPLGTVFRWQPLRSLGKLAYCVYLLQECVLLTVFSQIGGNDLALNTAGKWAVGIASMGLVVLVAQISWNKFESPLVRIGHRYKYAQPEPEERAERAASLAS